MKGCWGVRGGITKYNEGIDDLILHALTHKGSADLLSSSCYVLGVSDPPGVPGIAQVHYCDSVDGFNIMVMDLLGRESQAL